MNIKNSRKVLMGLAALLIFIFHFFPARIILNLSDTSYSLPGIKFLVKNAFIGVDIFFFLSGYMANFSDTTDIKSYYLKKFKKMYPTFFVFSLIYYLLIKFNPKNLILTLSGVTLWRDGGASFLWFIPALFIAYLLIPIFKKYSYKYGYAIVLLTSVIFITITLIVNKKVFHNQAINIMLLRLPIFFIANTLASFEGKWSRKKQIFIAFGLLVVGVYLLTQFVFPTQLNRPYYGLFYIFTIPFTISIIMIIDIISNKIQFKFLNYIGNYTLLLYCTQMLVGPFIFAIIAKYINSQLASAICLFIICLSSSIFIQEIIKIIDCRISNILERRI